MDPLVEIPRKRWGELLSLYQAKWPDGVVPSCMISTQLACPELEEDFMLKVYCPEGEINNGFVSITEQRDNNSYQVMVHPLNSSKAIETALLTTSKIEWDRFIMFPSLSPEMKQCLERIAEQLGVNVICDDSSKAIKHVLKKDAKPFADLSVPPNTYIGPIKAKDIEVVDKVWTYHNKHSYKLFECLIKHGLTYALYSLNHDILAWTTVNNGGAVGHLFCFEEHRKKGYAELIMKYVINDLIEKKVDILAFTIEGNVKPQRLFDKLGLEVVGHDYWVFTSKKTLPSDITFGLMSAEHAELVDSKWPHKYPGSIKHMEQLLEANSGYGLFKFGEVVSWALVNEVGNITHMYTDEPNTVLWKLVANIFLKEGKDVSIYCVRENVKARNFHTKMVFEITSDNTARLFFKPK